MSSEIPKAASHRHLLLAGPAATVFVSNFCIMAIELAAGRIIARQLGSSLYTWTSVIGVVLSGITLGYYIGGRIADRFKAVSILPVLFVLCSAGCVATVLAGNLVAVWPWLWQFDWVLRVFLHVLLIFLLPSTLLAIVTPVVAKAALERGLATGRTIGVIYAWGAAGSIAGTFAAGFYLLAAIGTQAILWLIAAILLLLAFPGGFKRRFVKIWAVCLLCAAALGLLPSQELSALATRLGLRPQATPGVVYEDETPYCYIAVASQGGSPERRIFVQDTLVHSEVLMGDATKLEYSYAKIMAAITHYYAPPQQGHGKDRQKPSFLILGGGGYVFPRYLEHFWPGSRVDVVEIDPGVTLAAQKAFGLDPASKINNISLDARNYIEQEYHRKNSDNPDKIGVKYDFIYEDALNNFSVPYQLTTHEFNQKLAKMLADDGVYMIELIDQFDSALFLGSMLNTLKQTFPYLSVISEINLSRGYRNLFVIVAARREIPLDKVFQQHNLSGSYRTLSQAELDLMNERSKGMFLTDDFAPVENLLAPVAKTHGASGLTALNELNARKLAEQMQASAWAGNLSASLAKAEELVKADPSMTVRGYAVIANIFADTNHPDEALKIYEVALKNYPSADSFSADLAQLHYDCAALLQKTGKFNEATEQLRQSADACKKALQRDPNSAYIHALSGQVAARMADFAKAAEHFKKAVEIDPANVDNHFLLVKALEAQGLIDEALESANASVQYFFSINRPAEAQSMQNYLKYIEQRKNQN